MGTREESSTLVSIDEALAADRVTAAEPEERELQELALALRAESPAAAAEFARGMDERLAAGFPRARAGTRRPTPARPRRRIALTRPSFPVLAGATTVLVVVVAGVSVLSMPDDETALTDGDSPTTEVAPAPDVLESSDAEDASGAGGGGSSAVAPSTTEGTILDRSRGGDALPGRDNRRVDRSAQVTLAAPADELQEVGAGIASVAERRRGVLMSSSLTTGESGRGGGSYELQVPVDELPSTLAELSDLATVRSLTQAGDDQTARFVRRGDDVDELRAELEELQAEAAVAADDELAAIRAEIRATRDEIGAAERAFERVRERTAFATIAITLVEGEERQTGLGAAVDDGVALLEDVLGIAIRALGVLLPLALIAALAGWVAGLLRRRARESALA